jgi:glycosyltransferase involved in cell wall biosynthesis
MRPRLNEYDRNEAMDIVITIITPVLNRVDLVRDAIDSVASAAGDVPFEHLVIDGGSTDGTVERLRQEARVRLIEAPGTNIYEALNLGIKVARGRLICHLNSDDLLPQGALQAIAAADLDAPAGCDGIRGHARYVDMQGQAVPMFDANFPAQLNLAEVTLGAPAINALVLRSATYRRIGLYDGHYRVAADREWLLRAFGKALCIQQIASPAYIYRVHEGSLTISPQHALSREVRLEHLAICRAYLADPATPPVLRDAYQRWQVKEATLLIYLTLAERSAGRLAEALRLTFTDAPLWPVRVPSYALRLMRRRMERQWTMARTP